MKKIVFQIIMGSFYFTITAQNFEWSKVIDKGYSIGKDIATDKWGNAYVTGHFDTVFLAKYNSVGNLIWAKGPGEGGNAVATDSTGTYLGGETHIAKYDTAGNLLWANYGAGLTDLATSPDGGFVVIGYMHDSVVLHGQTNTIILHVPPNRMSLYLAKYDNNGNLVWARSESVYAPQNVANYLRGTTITTDIYDNVFITGAFMGTVPFGPAPVTMNSSSDYNIFYAKYDVNGNFAWVKQSTGTGYYQEPHAIKSDSVGDIYIVGRFDAPSITFQGTTLSGGDMFLVKFNTNGNLLWANNGGVWAGEATALDVSLQGNLFVTGSFTKYMNYNGSSNTLTSTNWDCFILKLDLNGNLIWAAKTNNFSGQGMGSMGIASDQNENCFITGWLDGKVAFGDSTYSSSAYQDMFIAKINGTSNTSIKETSDHTFFRVSPNPSDGRIFISYKTDDEIKDAALQVKNSLGQIIYSKTYKAFTAEINDTIDLSKHAKGIYFMEIIADRKRTVRKVVVD